MNPRRAEKFRRVVSQRQTNLTVIMENVHDTHNIGAVLRSCDSVGVCEIFVLNTEPELIRKQVKIGKRTSMGTRRWVDVHLYTDAADCFKHVRSRYNTILATHLTKSAKSLYELDLTQSIALLFGNERDGLSTEALSYADGNFTIPQWGMAESLNISVACAVTLYEASRQRQINGFYTDNPTLNSESEQALLDDYHQRHSDRVVNRFPKGYE